MFDYTTIQSPIIFKGDETTAYRDPAVYYDGSRFHLFCTFIENSADGPYWFTVQSVSDDLLRWSAPVKLTPRDKALNFSSPGNVVRAHDGYRLCLQTYCNESGDKYGSENSRIWTMRSDDLVTWEAPRLLRVKGDIPQGDMGRMIDPFLLRDKDDPAKWWCLYKQKGMSASWSYDLENWTYQGRTRCGENVCAITKGDEYFVMHSPEKGLKMLRTNNFARFKRFGGRITLGQKQWPWARGRLTAGFILDLTDDPRYQKYLLFFHATARSERHDFLKNASIGLAWSDDLLDWKYAM